MLDTAAQEEGRSAEWDIWKALEGASLIKLAFARACQYVDKLKIAPQAFP